MAARSEDTANRAIAEIKAAWPASTGSMIFQHLDLADLSAVKRSADALRARDTKLHVLFNNAGVQLLDPNAPNKTAQGHEIHLGVNVIGTFLFTKLLTPMLINTAKSEPVGSVRVVWVSSLGTEMVGEKSYGLSLDYLKYWPALSPLERYGISKAGNWLHGIEFARQQRRNGVVSVPVNPGHLRSDLYRDSGTLFKTFLNTFVTYPPINGAYTELFGGLSPSVTIEKSGDWGMQFAPIASPTRYSMRESGHHSCYLFFGCLECMANVLQLCLGVVFIPFAKISLTQPSRKPREEMVMRRSSGNGLRSKSKIFARYSDVW